MHIEYEYGRSVDDERGSEDGDGERHTHDLRVMSICE